MTEQVTYTVVESKDVTIRTGVCYVQVVEAIKGDFPQADSAAEPSGKHTLWTSTRPQ